MDCSECKRTYDLIVNNPLVVCSNKHTMCEHCVCALPSSKTNVCGRCSEPLLASAKLCTNTTMNINNKLPRGTVIITLLLITGLLGYLYKMRKLGWKDLENMRLYFIVNAVYFFVAQWFTLLGRIVPEVCYLRKNKHVTKAGTSYIFAVILRHASLWNCNTSVSFIKLLVGLVKYTWYSYNIFYYLRNVKGIGSDFVLSAVLTVLSMAELPVLNKLMIRLNNAIRFLVQGITLGLRAISQILLEMFVYSIVLGLGVLAFYGYMFEIQFLSIFEYNAYNFWMGFLVPVVIMRKIEHAGIKWLITASYQNICLVIPAFFRRNIILDLIIGMITLPKFILVGSLVFIQYSLYHTIGLNHEMKTQICSLLSVLLTPMHIALYMLLKQFQL